MTKIYICIYSVDGNAFIDMVIYIYINIKSEYTKYFFVLKKACEVFYNRLSVQPMKTEDF